MNDIEKRARELLAAEWLKLSFDAPVDELRAGCEVPPVIAAVVRAIIAVLTPQWQPIETAPRGLVLFCDMGAAELRNSFFVDWMVDGQFCGNRHRTATHWLPLPAAPVAVEVRK